jgi:phosphoribosylformylglycinamidine (FGAM) synthase PurS component
VTRRAVSIALKIPDNEAYTALVALRRLGVEVERVERSEIFLFDDDGNVDALVARITADETIFNPNKHRVSVLETVKPRWGEVWIEPRVILSPSTPLGVNLVEGGRATHRFAVAWQLFDARGTPVKRPVLETAIERLLCNPAIDRPLTSLDASDRDIPLTAE